MSGSKRMTRHALFPPKEIKTFIAKLPNRPQSPLTPSDTVSLVKKIPRPTQDIKMNIFVFSISM